MLLYQIILPNTLKTYIYTKKLKLKTNEYYLPKIQITT